MEVVFALITATAFGFDYYCVRKGLIAAPFPMVAAFATLTVNVVFFIVLTMLFVPADLFKPWILYPFFLAGVLAPGCARLFSYKGLETLGMGICTPIINAESLFSGFLALVFLREKISVLLVTGFISAVGGLVLLGYETGRRSRIGPAKNVRYRYLFYPVAASACYGISVFFRKLGLTIVDAPILGAAITSGTSWCILAVLFFSRGHARSLREVGKTSMVYFLTAGVMTCIAWLSLFYALSIGRVTVVSPVANSYSLITLLFGYLLLRDVERITPRMVVATVLVVAGIVFISAGR